MNNDDNWGVDKDGNMRIMNQPDIDVDFVPENNWDETEWNVFAGWLRGVLIVQPAKVTFIKKDGSERVMKCTLREDLLPKQEITENKTERKKSDATMAVYDLEAQGWRSFTLTSVKRVEFTIN